MTLGLPDPLVRGMDPDPKPAHALATDPSIIEQKSYENLDFEMFCTFFGLFIVEK